MILNKTIATAGNSGGKTRSDCQVTVEITDAGGIVVELRSKVKTLYGNEIIEQSRHAADFFGLKNVRIYIEDSGALPWVIDARIESAVKDMADVRMNLIPERRNKPATPSLPDRLRFSRLYLPGNTPSLMLNAFLHGPDGLILDLEDAVAPDKKSEARVLVRNALRSIDFGESERMVRINQYPAGLQDLDWIIPQGVNLVLLPKCESDSQIREVSSRISEILSQGNLTDPVWIMPIIESALGVVRAYEIATATSEVVALAIGLEDYTADLGVTRTEEGQESFYARAAIINACKAAGIQAIDSVFSDVADNEGLKRTALRSKAMGFDGMGCIHPRQIAVIHESFAPDAEEIEKARKIVSAFNEAQKKGLGVVALGTKMIDAPVVKRARKTIDLAVGLGLLPAGWDHQGT